MTQVQIKERLMDCHERENFFNLLMGRNNKQIKELQVRNKKLAKAISKNMLYRNQLIEKIERHEAGNVNTAG